jgi:DNA-binding CsgD family transcriptional regulator
MNYLENLTKREYEILTRVSLGQQNKEVALGLNIAVHTVEQHLKHIYQKLKTANRTQASIIYWKYNIPKIDGDPLYTS